jgi:phage head maturation protease
MARTAERLHRAIGVVELRADSSAAGDGRTLDGVAMPYGQRFEVGGMAERFPVGAFRRHLGMIRSDARRERNGHATVPYLDRHEGNLLGLAEVWEDGPAVRFSVHIENDPHGHGDQYLTMVRAGASTGVSVEFAPVTDRMADDGRTLDRAEARLLGLAGAYAPAYQGAQILAVRAAAGATSIDTPRRDRYDAWRSRPSIPPGSRSS